MPTRTLAALLSLALALAEPSTDASSGAQTGAVGVVVAEANSSSHDQKVGAGVGAGRVGLVAAEDKRKPATGASAGGVGLPATGSDALGGNVGKVEAEGAAANEANASSSGRPGNAGLVGPEAAVSSAGASGPSVALKAELPGGAQGATEQSAKAQAVETPAGQVSAKAARTRGNLRGGIYACLGQLSKAGLTKDLYFCGAGAAAQAEPAVEAARRPKAGCCAGTFQAYCTPSHSFCAWEHRMPSCSTLFPSCYRVL